MKRILGLDIGKVRIGVAISDPLGTFAQGIAVLEADRDWIPRIRELVRERAVGLIVVGVPVRTDGSSGPEAEGIWEVIRRLREELDEEKVEVTGWDERFSTTAAERALLEGDMSRKRRRKVIDKVAASMILQSFLENRRDRN